MIPPQDVREASDGAFWLVQGGSMVPFRSLPVLPAPPRVTAPAGADHEVEHAAAPSPENKEAAA